MCLQLIDCRQYELHSRGIVSYNLEELMMLGSYHKREQTATSRFSSMANTHSWEDKHNVVRYVLHD